MYLNLKGPVNIGNPKSNIIDELSKIIIKMFDKKEQLILNLAFR